MSGDMDLGFWVSSSWVRGEEWVVGGYLKGFQGTRWGHMSLYIHIFLYSVWGCFLVELVRQQQCREGELVWGEHRDEHVPLGLLVVRRVQPLA